MTIDNVARGERLQRLGITLPDILLPKAGTDLSKWAVVACDQYTSDQPYWDKVDQIVGDAPSTVRITLPEIYLEQPGVEGRIQKIHAAMADYQARGILESKGEGLIYLKRTTEHSGTREGIVVAMDLECYDYARDSKSLIRATEGTIVERIPPRLAVRRDAPLELPHIMILVDDPERQIIESLAEKTSEFVQMYDINLMNCGGHLQGWSIKNPEHINDIIRNLEFLLDKTVLAHSQHPLFYAVGDGNHSLAAAKVHWENIKNEMSLNRITENEIMKHPARFTLVEIVNIHSPGLCFEPIHRAIFTNKLNILTDIVKNDSNSVVTITTEEEAKHILISPDGQDKVIYFNGKDWYTICYMQQANKLPTSMVDELFDNFKNQDRLALIDFVHGWNETKKLANEGVGVFFTPVISREKLFSWVQENGPLPKKSFSLGNAEEKRYYMEARQIVK